ncbi:MAG: hypothetical protein RSD49_18275 [Hafnia sp.]
MARLLKIVTLQPREEEGAKIDQVMREAHFSDNVRCFGQYDDDGERATLVFTDDKQTIRLLDELMASNIRWRTYSGRYMFGEHTIGVACGYGITESDVTLATSIDLARDALEMGSILYLK